MKHWFVPLNGIQWLTLVLLVAVVAGFTYGFIQISNARQEANAGNRTGWCYLESLVLNSKRSTPEKKHQTVVVIRHLLAKIGEPDCDR